MISTVRPDRLVPQRVAPAAVAGLLLAALAEACSVGLIGLSGWFIAGSAVAGAGAYSAFSYLTPSGGVRAFAMARIVTGYASRVVLHFAALRRVSAARLRFYDRTAAMQDGEQAWSGQSLDRVMADADTQGMALIQATAPMWVAAATTAGGCLVIAIAGYRLTAVVVAAGAAACVALAMAAVPPLDASRARGGLRAELVTAVDAWAEMASLGATDQLAQRTLGRLAAFEDLRLRQAAAQARTAGAGRAATAATLLLAIVSASTSGADVMAIVFVVLLAAGVMANAERLAAAADAGRQSAQARERLDSAGPERPPGRAGDRSSGPPGAGTA